MPLHKRGYRSKIHKAALNESLASGLILLSDWDKKNNFYDIMCGSGTLPIEASMIANKIAPGQCTVEPSMYKISNRSRRKDKSSKSYNSAP